MYFKGTFLNDCCNTPAVGLSASSRVAEEGYGLYSPSLIPPPTVQKSRVEINSESYLQSFKYFDSVSNQLMEKLHLSDDIVSAVQSRCRSLGLVDDTVVVVGVHIRRGDRVDNKDLTYMQFPTEKYFLSAFLILKQRAVENGRPIRFLVVSDDIAWCMQQPIFQSADFSFLLPAKNNASADENAMIDFGVLVQRCDHIVQSLGTYGWWASWLKRRPGIVICNEDEYDLSHPTNRGKFSKDDFYPAKWTRLDNDGKVAHNGALDDDAMFDSCTLQRPFTNEAHNQEVEKFRAAGWNAMKEVSHPERFAGGIIYAVGNVDSIDLDRILRAPQNVTVYLSERNRIASKPQNNRLRFASSIAELSSMKIDLLHVDCENCEFELLVGLCSKPSASLLVDAIEVQFHVGVTVVEYCKVETCLRTRGYELKYRFSYVWELWRRRNE